MRSAKYYHTVEEHTTLGKFFAIKYEIMDWGEISWKVIIRSLSVCHKIYFLAYKIQKLFLAQTLGVVSSALTRRMHFNYAAIPAFFTKFPTTIAAVTVLWDKFSVLCWCKNLRLVFSPIHISRSALTLWPQRLCCSAKNQLNPLREVYGGTRWRNWFRHCATSRKVAGSIPDGVVGIFHWHNPSGRTMAMGLTQPLTEMSTRNIY